MKPIPVRLFRKLNTAFGPQKPSQDRVFILRAQLTLEKNGDLGFKAGAEGVVAGGVKASAGGSIGRHSRRTGDNEVTFAHWSPSKDRVALAKALVEAGISTGNSALAAVGARVMEMPQAFDMLAEDVALGDIVELDPEVDPE